MTRLSRFIIIAFIVTFFFIVKAGAGSVTADQPASNPNSLSLLPPRQVGPVGFLTGPAEGNPLDIAQAYIQAHHAQWGLTEGDLEEMVVQKSFVSQHNQTTHIYWRQRLEGIEVYNGDIAVHVAADGSIIAVHNQFVSDLRSRVNSTKPVLTAGQAVQMAAEKLGLSLRAPLSTVKEIGGEAQAVLFSNGGISLEDIPAQLIYQPLDDGTVRLAWDLSIYEPNAQNWWSLRLDAANGVELSRVNWVVNENWETAAAAAEAAGWTLNSTIAAAPSAPDQYQVYHFPVESPSHSSPASPADGRTTQVNPADTVASPYGWHDTNGTAGAEYTVTRGNNVYAYTDTDANNSPDVGSSPDGGPSLNFSFPLNLTLSPSGYRPAAVTNLFHWNNLMHDVWYHYGFDEASGNFQTNNYGRGGVGNDEVRAEAQDGFDVENANFATPADGLRPRMQMFLWPTPDPDRDGDLDNGIIAHEYGHGISNRLVGNSVNCLQNNEQMGEGWSDWFGLMMTLENGDAGTDSRGIGTYALNQPPTGVGIRAFPYSTNLATDPRTYDTIKTASAPHGVGSVWAAMVWEMSWAFIQDYGFDPNLYTGTGGNNMAMQLVIDGLKLTPCNPGFVDSRNAILLADLNNYNGAHQCLIWTAFAKRGLGVSALQGSTTNKNDGTQAFDVPASCNLLDDITPQTASICSLVANTVNYSVWVGESFTAPVAMSASGHPAGSTPTFSPNPVSPVKRLTFLGLDVPIGTAGGSYPITISGSGTATENEIVNLNVYSATPAATSLSSPANGAIDMGYAPTLVWNGQIEASDYTIEIATDAAMTNLVGSAAGLTGTSYNVTTALSPQTVYYWRVRTSNPCGLGTYSDTFSFLTGANVCTTYTSTDVPKTISGGSPNSVSSTLNVAGGDMIGDINVVGLVGTHTLMSDLDFNLISPATTSVEIITRQCGSTDNFNLNLDDEAAAGALPCPPVGGITRRPSNPLTAFDVQNSSGTWTLRIDDNATVDGGSLTSWGLQICTAGTAAAADYSDLANHYGVAWHSGTGALRLGTNWTADSGFTADADDASDDGVVRGGSNWTGNANVSLAVTVSGGDGNDFLACWFDWNDNGVLANPAERTVAQVVNDGLNNINFTIPAGFNPATNPVLDSRCRLYEAEPNGALESSETPAGGVVDGEVEDYRWGFSPTAVTLLDSRLATISNTTWLAVSLAALMVLSLAVAVAGRVRSKEGNS